MLKRILIAFVAIAMTMTTVMPAFAATSLQERLSGRILLQVEENGEAWYVNPLDNLRYYMGRPDDAFSIMRNFGLGVTNADLNKIPIGLIGMSGQDSDNDGLTDMFEDSQGTNSYRVDTDGDGYTDSNEIFNGYSPLNPAPEKIYYNPADAERLAGRILLQVESHGEAWYVNPVDNRRYYLGRPADAFAIMRHFGLGITNADLSTMPYGLWQGPSNPPVSTPDPEPVPDKTPVFYNVYDNPLFMINHPSDWQVNDSAIYLTGSYFAAHPNSEAVLSDPSYDMIIDVQSLHTHDSSTIESRAYIMRKRYVSNEDTIAIYEDQRYNFNGMNGWRIRAGQKSDLYFNSDYKEDVTTVLQVKPGYFIAVSASIEKDENYAENLALYNTMFNTLSINYANWNNYTDYTEAGTDNFRGWGEEILPKKSGYESNLEWYEVSGLLTTEVRGNWETIGMTMDAGDTYIDETIDDILTYATDEDLQMVGGKVGMTSAELKEALVYVQDSLVTDVVAIANFDHDAYTAIIRSETPDGTTYRNETTLELLLVAAYFESDVDTATAMKVSSRYLSVAGYPAIQDEYVVDRDGSNDPSENDKANIFVTRITMPDNTVYSIVSFSSTEEYDSNKIDFNLIVNSFGIIK